MAKAPLTTAVMQVDFQCQNCATRAVEIAASTIGCYSVSVDMEKGLLTVKGSMNVMELVSSLRVSRMTATIFSVKRELVPVRKTGGGGDDDDDGNNNEGNGSGGGDEKNEEEDEGNGGGKMKYPAGQYGYGQFSYRTVYRHGYGYQNGALKMGEKCCYCAVRFLAY